MAAHSPASAVAIYNIVVAVTTNGGLERIGRDQDERLGEQPNRAPHVDHSLMEFSRQDIAKLVEQRSRRNDDVVADEMHANSLEIIDQFVKHNGVRQELRP